jgi:hypothetical protein
LFFFFLPPPSLASTAATVFWIADGAMFCYGVWWFVRKGHLASSCACQCEIGSLHGVALIAERLCCNQ